MICKATLKKLFAAAVPAPDESESAMQALRDALVFFPNGKELKAERSIKHSIDC